MSLRGGQTREKERKVQRDKKERSVEVRDDRDIERLLININPK